MSAPTPVAGAPAPAALRCPRCEAAVAPEQDWCLECGAPARTRMADPPSWRLPLALVAVVVLACGLALAVAFASLTKDDGVVRGTTSTAVVDPNTGTTTALPTAPPVGQTVAP